MTYRILFFHLLVTLFFGNFFLETAAGFKQTPMQLQDIEQEMAEANKVIEEYIASLPPEVQADFNRQVEEMTRQFESMSDEDFDKFLNDMFNEESMPQPDFSQMPQPMEEDVAAPVEVDAEQLKKVETAIAILSDIIKQSNRFIVLINSLPELPNRINKWGTKGLISDWQQGMTWDTLKIDLEYFIQKLYKIQEQDLTTKEYKYLLDLIANESLYNNIVQLKTNLNTVLPIINIPEFGIQKISAQSKEAIQTILNKYTESFYLLATPKALDAIFEKYEPQAKKIRDAESAASRRALEASQEPRSPAEWSEAGVESEMGYDSGYGSYGYNDYSSYGGGYDNYSPYYGGDSYGGYDNYSSSNDFNNGSGGTSDGSGGGARSAGGREKSFDDKKDDEKKDTEKEQAGEYIPNDQIAELIGKMKGTLTGLNKIISGEEYSPSIPKIAELFTHISDTESTVNEDLASLVLPIQIGKKIIELTNDIKKIDSIVKKEKLNSTTLKTYQKEIRKLFDKNNTKELNELKKIITQFEPQTKEELATIELATKTSGKEQEGPKKVDVKTLSLEKRWAYFVDTDAKKELEESGNDTKEKFVEKISNPKSLFNIKKDIDTLLKEVDAFGKKKAVKVIAKKAVEAVEMPTIE